MVIVKKIMPTVDEVVEQLDPSNTTDETVNWYNHLENDLVTSYIKHMQSSLSIRRELVPETPWMLKSTDT